MKTVLDVIDVHNNGCLSLHFLSGGLLTDIISLSRFDSSGNLLWKRNYISPDTNILNSAGNTVIEAPEGGFLITGDCYYRDPDSNKAFRLKPYYIKTDSLGNLEWELVVHKNEGALKGGSAWSTSLNTTNTIYYSSISNYYPGERNPALVTFDLDGNLLSVFDIVTGYDQGGLGYATFINDTVLAASIGWGNSLEDHRGYAILIDSIGNILDTTLLVQDIYSKHQLITFDNKLVYLYNTFQNNKFDAHLTKLNFKLEQDTFNTFPFQYDSLCPYPIISDTIGIENCDLIVGIKEPLEQPEPEKSDIVVYPNPATEMINVQCSMFNEKKNLWLEIYDLFGREIEEVKVPAGQQKVSLDVAHYPPGLYVAVLRSEREILGRARFVVVR